MALDVDIDMLERGGQRLVDRRIAKTFGGEALVVRELRRLRDLNHAAEHYRLGAYRNALLYAVLPNQLEVINEARDDGDLLSFCNGRYLVRELDVEAFVDTFFEDADFVLPRDVVNAFTACDKSMLGLHAAVFGVANAQQPQEGELHRLHERDPDGVLAAFEAMGVVYRRGAAFPYCPAWLAT